MNTLKTGLLLVLLTSVLVAAGGLLGGRGGMMIAFVLAVLMNFSAYWFSDRLALAMSGARELPPGALPRYEAAVERLCVRANLPRPRLYVIPEDQPNAFATGRNPHHSAVAVTEGLLRLMNDEELEGVLAHELAHVRNRDILIASVAATIAGAVQMMAQMAQWAALFGGLRGDDDDDGGGIVGLLATMIFAPIAATLVQLAISRSREFAADKRAVEFTGHPYGLARALKRLGEAAERVPMPVSPATAHMYIVSPLAGRYRPMLASLFSTHPSLEERIRRLVGDHAP